MKVYEFGNKMVCTEDEEMAETLSMTSFDELLDRGVIKTKYSKYHEESDLDHIGLSIRAVACIKHLGITTVDEFKKTEPDFYDRSKNPKVRNVNDRVFQEITTKLNELKHNES